MKESFFVGVGGFLGSLGRFWLGRFFSALFATHLFPWGTWIINMVGCLCIGLFMGFFLKFPLQLENYRLFFAVGFLGAFTTFSAFSFETLMTLDSGHWGLAIGNIFLSVTACLVATYVGLIVTR